jgi:hypothetical protein
MARTSLAAAKAELFAMLSAGAQRCVVSGVKAAYDYEPGPGRAAGPIALTVTTTAIDPDEWSFALRLYADGGTDPAGVHAALDQIMPAITDVISDRWGPESWVGPNPHPDRDDVLVCEWIVSCGREDD